MQIKRSASARWNGTGKEGNGVLSTKSGVLDNTQYSYNSRFAEGIGTNPEELIGAAHAGCFSMKLAFVLQEGGIMPEEIATNAVVVFEEGKIIEVQLETKVKSAGADEGKFQECATKAKETCPVSLLLNCKISLTATLN